MIVVTGAAGFIGSNLVTKLNQMGIKDLTLFDKFGSTEKNKNLVNKRFNQIVDRDRLFDWLDDKDNAKETKVILHIGARTDTTESDKQLLYKLNTGYSIKLWEYCTRLKIPYLYASSAATYGAGEFGYEDNHKIINSLKPLNAYGDSKNEFDKWVLTQKKTPPYWHGFKFFNVYGPNEYHKGRMASVIFHAFNQIKDSGGMKLFRSHNPQYKDGEQLRDFIYVKDVVNVLTYFMNYKKNSAIYNLGTGKARTFLDLVRSTFKAMNVPENIDFVDTPMDIRDKYQYFTEAKMNKLRGCGYNEPFTSLESGVEDYVKNYLMNHHYI